MTGGIGSGKSEALAAFAACGAAVLSSDAVVHQLYDDPEVVAAVAERFGADVVGPGGVDRALLGARAFAEEGGIGFLEALIHPRVERRRRAWMDAAGGAPSATAPAGLRGPAAVRGRRRGPLRRRPAGDRP